MAHQRSEVFISPFGIQLVFVPVVVPMIVSNTSIHSGCPRCNKDHNLLGHSACDYFHVERPTKRIVGSTVVEDKMKVSFLLN